MKYILIIVTCLLSHSINAQVPTKPVPSSIEKAAEDLVERYNEELVLTSVQIPLFKNKIEDYMVLAEEIKANMDGKDELDALLKLQTKETLQMKNILTQPQLELYKKMKPTVQPLKVVD